MHIGDPIDGGAPTDYLFVDKDGNLGQVAVTIGTFSAGAYTIPTGTWLVVMDVGAGSLSSATITLPSSPYDKQVVIIGITNEIDTFSLVAPGGATVFGAPTTLLSSGTIICVYNAADTQWKCGSGSIFLGINSVIGLSASGANPGDILYVNNGRLVASVAAGQLNYNPTTGEFLAQMQGAPANWIWMPPGFIELAHDTGIQFSNYAGIGVAADYNITHAGAWMFQAPIVLGSQSTIAGLPASPVLGMTAVITDGDAGLAWGATAVNSGGSSTKYMVWYNGANWTVMGK